MAIVKFPSLQAGRDRNKVNQPRKPQPRAEAIAALDIGSSRISCMIAERVAQKSEAADPRNSIKITGFGHIASGGVRGGAVVNIEEAERAIRLAVDAAEQAAGRSISSVYVNVSGGKPSCIRHHGHVLVNSGIVTAADIDNAVVSALHSAVIGQRAVLHLSQIGFHLDGVESRVAPLGLHGRELGVDLGVVTIEPAALHNITTAVNRSHLEVKNFVLTPLASAKATLAADEMELGTAVIDIGHAVTCYGLVQHGGLIAAETIPLGAHHLTVDLAQGLCTNLAHAERLKTLHGSLISSGHDANEMVSFALVGESGKDAVQRVTKGILAQVLQPRVEELLEIIAARLAEAPFPVMRVVFTGGGSELSGLREMAQSILQRHVRIGRPDEMRGLNDITGAPAQAVCAGLLCQALSPERHYAMPEEAADAIVRQQLTYTQRLGRWFKEAL
jgi:cell division protein FtsA